MAEKPKKKRLRFLAIFAILFIFAIALGCNSFSMIYRVEQFDYFLQNLSSSQNEPSNGTDLEPDPTPVRFTPLVNADFEEGLPFSNNFTLAKYQDKVVAISRNGEIFFTQIESLELIELHYDHFVFSQDFHLGVKNIFGQVVVAPEYREIRIFENLIVATGYDGLTCVFLDSERKHTMLEGFSAFSNSLLLKNGYLFDLELNLKTIEGYRVVFDKVNGFYIITNGNALGFATSERVVIKPQFISASVFNQSGYARVETADSTFKIICTAGEIAFIEGEYRIVNFLGEKAIFFDDFNRPLLLSLDYTPILDEYFLQIDQIADLFLAQNSYKEFILFDLYFNEILRYTEQFHFNGSILTLNENGRVSYFTSLRA